MDYSIIKKLLEERNISFKELSDKLGVDRNNLYNSLTKGNPTLQRFRVRCRSAWCSCMVTIY